MISNPTKQIIGKFEVYTDKGDKYRFRLKASNGQPILASQGYASKASCMNGIESVKKNAGEDAKFLRLTAKDGSPYFDLIAENKQVIGTSQMYSSKESMENGIASVKKNAPSAPIEELS